MHLFQDLTKWKNRRRSTKSDLRRKSHDRDHVINQMINGASTSFERNEAGGFSKRYKHTLLNVCVCVREEQLTSPDNCSVSHSELM